MQFSKVFLAAAAFAVAQVSAVQFTNPSFAGITAGSAFNVSWSDASGTVTLTLKDGPANALQTVDTIASGLSGGSFIWTPSASLASGTYALQIDDSTGIPNYSVPFTLSGGVASASSAASSASSSLSSLVSSATSALASITGNSTSSAFSAATTTTSATTTSSKSTSSKTSSSAAGTGTQTTAPSSAAGLSSPIALIFLAFAAFLTLN